MEELLVSAATASPIPSLYLAPLGLSENDRLRITDCVRSVAPEWQMDLEEDAFDQPALVVAPCNANRLRLALIAYRINASYILDEVREGIRHEAGEFPTIGSLLEALRNQLVRYTAMPVE